MKDMPPFAFIGIKSWILPFVSVSYSQSVSLGLVKPSKAKKKAKPSKDKLSSSFRAPKLVYACGEDQLQI